MRLTSLHNPVGGVVRGAKRRELMTALSICDGHFGQWIDLPIDRSGLVLVSVLSRHGLKPLKVLLPHQLYLHDVLAIQSEGDVVVTTIPIARDHLNVSAALRKQNEAEPLEAKRKE